MGIEVFRMQAPLRIVVSLTSSKVRNFVGDADVFRHSVNRHLPGKYHHGLLEQQSEVTAWTRPGNIDPVDAMLKDS